MMLLFYTSQKVYTNYEIVSCFTEIKRPTVQSHACSFLSHYIVKPPHLGSIPVRRLSCSMLPNTDARFSSTEIPDAQLFCITGTPKPALTFPFAFFKTAVLRRTYVCVGGYSFLKQSLSLQVPFRAPARGAHKLQKSCRPSGARTQIHTMMSFTAYSFPSRVAAIWLIISLSLRRNLISTLREAPLSTLPSCARIGAL